MKIRKLAAIPLLLLTSFLAFGAAPSASQLESMYDKAFRAFDTAKYDEALKALDAIDARQPDLAESHNLRGVVYMRQEKYDKAEAVFRKALSIEPRFWNASFNLAEISFQQKNWAEARNRFEALMAGESDGMLPETKQLIQYKILLTFVLQGKDKTVDWILNKFESAKDSPALYYANAAIAFQHANTKEAQDWMTAARKKFSAPLNKLYAESFYDIGWIQKPAGEPRAALEITSSTARAERLKADAQANLEEAERALQQRDFDRALKSLEDVEEGMANDPAAANLRGKILMEQKKLDEAEGMFQKALAANPEFREAQYNLALILFKKGDYNKSRDRFEALYSETPGGEKNQATQLIKFNIFLTLLLEEKEAEARQLMEQFKFTGDTPALYYAQAAWEFKHDGMERGADWVDSARKIYSPALNMIFADSFDGLGWLKGTKTETTPVTSALAQANASPAQGPMPALRFGAAETSRPLETTEGPAPVTDEATAKAAAVATPVSSPISAAKPTAPPRIAPTTRAAAKPASKALASEKVRPWSWKAFSENNSSVSRPRNLLVAALVLTGVALLVWLAVRQFRRGVSSAIADSSGEPSTDPSLPGESAPGGEETVISPDLLSGGPSKVSIELEGSEPFVLKPAVSMNGIMAGASAAEVAAPVAISPSGPQESLPAQPGGIQPEPLVPKVGEVGAEVSTPEEQVAHSSSEEPVTAIAEEPTPKVDRSSVEATGPDAARPEGGGMIPETGFVLVGEPEMTAEEPVGQGQPIPQLATAFAAEPVISELAQPEAESVLVLIEREAAVAAPIVARQTASSSVETPSFASNVITSQPSQQSPPAIFPDFMADTPAVATDFALPKPPPTMSIEHPDRGVPTTVRISFALEVAGMQLTPDFKMSRLQLKPTSKVVSMRFESSEADQPLTKLPLNFEVAKIDLSGQSIETLRLTPSAHQKPAITTTPPSFSISGVEVIAGSATAPVQLIASSQERPSVELTAEFRIAEIEFSPIFEIANIVLSPISNRVSMQFPGYGPASIDLGSTFEIESVGVAAGNGIGLIRVASRYAGT